MSDTIDNETTQVEPDCDPVRDLTTLTIANPFYAWAEAVRGLRDRFVKELGPKRPFGDYTGPVVGELAAMITRANHLHRSLYDLARYEPEAYDAFIRALENS